MTGWFAARTYSSGDFRIAELAERKAASDRTVSVVLPARNVADTVAGMVQAALSLQRSLVDEVVVMAGASDDGTAEVARGAGARVYADDEVLADFGPAQGKGDALWRALAATSGDIVVYVDADIHNPSPRFVWGLLGPLLTVPEVAFVKGFYDRPFTKDGVVDRAGGGRVTELCARPLLNLLWPELRGIVQPLSGEYAGRRELLQELPYFTGYGVEMGLLIDALRHAGLDAIAQVDLGVRLHDNQPLADLSAMARVIAEVALQRLSDEDRAPLAAFPATYTQFGRDGRGRVTEELREVRLSERPPLATAVQR